MKDRQVSSLFFRSPHHQWRAYGQLLMVSLMMGLIVVGGSGCKNKKKLAEEQARAAAAEKARELSAAREDLQALMGTPVRDMNDLDSRERKLAEIKSRNIDDPDIRALIADVEDFLAAERDRLQAKNNPTPPPPPSVDPNQVMKQQLSQQFSDISRAGNLSIANSKIQQALGMFASANTPVLIIINQSNGMNDYDRPTTIQKYLNYLKDNKVNPNDIYEMNVNGSGKISELLLIKR